MLRLNGVPLLALLLALLLLSPKASAQTRIEVTYNGLPVRGWLQTPSNVASANVVVLYHPTIEESGVTPMDAAARYMKMATDTSKINIAASTIIFACAYPQDAIPGWSAQQASDMFPGIILDQFYLGDNIVYAQAALEWALAEASDVLGLQQYLRVNGLPRSTGVVSMFGHSQGAYIAHILNTRVKVTGRVVSNAPGPIDLGAVCAAVAGKGIRGSLQCDKLNTAFGPPSTAFSVYNSRSLRAYLSNLSAPILYTQGLSDASNQVDWMINIVQPGIKACSGCADVAMKYYCGEGHAAFTNPICANDIRSFLLFQTQSTTKFDVNLPSACPLLPYQVALIVLASIHIIALCVNVAVLKRFKLSTKGRVCFAALVPVFGWFVALRYVVQQRNEHKAMASSDSNF